MFIKGGRDLQNLNFCGPSFPQSLTLSFLKLSYSYIKVSFTHFNCHLLFSQYNDLILDNVLQEQGFRVLE